MQFFFHSFRISIIFLKQCRSSNNDLQNHKSFLWLEGKYYFQSFANSRARRSWRRLAIWADRHRVRRVFWNQNKNISDWQIEARFTVRNFRRRSITDGVLSFLLWILKKKIFLWFDFHFSLAQKSILHCKICILSFIFTRFGEQIL